MPGYAKNAVGGFAAAGAWGNRGLTYQYRMEPDKALSDFAKAIELDPKSAAGHNNIAWLLVTWPDPNLRNPAR